MKAKYRLLSLKYSLVTTGDFLLLTFFNKTDKKNEPMNAQNAWLNGYCITYKGHVRLDSLYNHLEYKATSLKLHS